MTTKQIFGWPVTSISGLWLTAEEDLCFDDSGWGSTGGGGAALQGKYLETFSSYFEHITKCSTLISWLNTINFKSNFHYIKSQTKNINHKCTLYSVDCQGYGRVMHFGRNFSLESHFKYLSSIFGSFLARLDFRPNRNTSLTPNAALYMHKLSKSSSYIFSIFRKL